MILGIAGLNASGKGEAVRFFEERRKFSALSLSDVVRDKLKADGVSETRDRMIDAGIALRAAGGPGVLAMRTLEAIEPERSYAIDSIRHPAEVDAFRDPSDPFRSLGEPSEVSNP